MESRPLKTERGLKMRRSLFFLFATSVLLPVFLTGPVEGHGRKKGNRELVATRTNCVTPSQMRVWHKWRTLYTLNRPQRGARAPSEHYHYSYTANLLKYGDSGYSESCNTYKTVCTQIKYNHATCGKSKSEEDQDCNRFAEPWDEREVYDTYIKYYRWIDDPNDCWQELVLP